MTEVPAATPEKVLLEVPAATPEKVLQLCPYIAKYDSQPYTNTTDADAKKAAFDSEIHAGLTRLLSDKSPDKLTKDDFLKWLFTTEARYYSVGSELGPKILDPLREQMREMMIERVLNPTQMVLCRHIYDTLSLPWGFDDFGKEDYLRNKWESALIEALNKFGCSTELRILSGNLGGYFGLNESLRSVRYFEELMGPDDQKVIELDRKCDDIRDGMSRSTNYSQRLNLLIPFRQEIFDTLKSYLSGLTEASSKNTNP